MSSNNTVKILITVKEKVKTNFSVLLSCGITIKVIKLIDEIKFHFIYKEVINV